MKVKINIIVSLLILFVFPLTLVMSCQDGNSKMQSHESKAIKTEENNQIPDTWEKSSHVVSSYEAPIGYFSPLTYEKFQNVISNEDNCSEFFIGYSIHPDEEPAILRSLFLKSGICRDSNRFSDLLTFIGKYNRYNDLVDPPETTLLEETFTNQQVIQYIISYLEQHNEYFFDGLEYTGLEIPYESYGSLINDGENRFLLSIYEPENCNNAWTISKCSDNPDPILQGLLDIMETNFMSVFED
jgi:hypothetical protein